MSARSRQTRSDSRSRKNEKVKRAARRKQLRIECEMLEERRLLCAECACSCYTCGPAGTSPAYSVGGDDQNPGETTEAPVRYADGLPVVESHEIDSGGFTPWSFGRSWARTSTDGQVGKGWNLDGLPYLRQDPSNRVTVVDSGTDERWFDLSGGVYTPKVFVKDRLKYDSGTHIYTLYDAYGGRYRFYDFTLTGADLNKRGTFIGYTDPSGDETKVAATGGYDTSGRIARIERTGGGVTEAFQFTRDSAGRTTLLEQLQGSNLVRRAAYSYYGSSDTWGSTGDLKAVTLGDAQTTKALSGINYSGTTATVALTGHGYAEGDTVTITGASQEVYNGTYVIHVVDANSFTYTMAGTPTANSTAAKVDKPWDVSYYRYYKSGDANGYAGGLKLALDGRSYARLRAGGVNPFLSTTLDGTVDDYAEYYFQYDANQRVTLETAQGFGGGGAGLGTYKFQYFTNPNGSAWNPNFWRNKMVEILPDDTPSDDSDNERRLYYTNEVNQPLLRGQIKPLAAQSVSIARTGGDLRTARVTLNSHGFNNGDFVIISGANEPQYNGVWQITNVTANTFDYRMESAPAGNATGTPKAAKVGTKWMWFYQYNNKGQVILSAPPSAVTGLDELNTTGDLLIGVWNGTYMRYSFLNDYAGDIMYVSYGAATDATDTTAGDVADYYASTVISRGELGGSAVLRRVKYWLRGDLGDANIIVYPLAQDLHYRYSNGTGEIVTYYDYTFVGNTTQIESSATKLPLVDYTQNGHYPDAYNIDTVYYDTYGRPVWLKNPRGAMDYFEYDPYTGAVTKRIEDVNTANTGDFTGKPSTWSNTAGLHLITTTEVDRLGRVTKQTDPDPDGAGSLTGSVTYSVYKDYSYEARIYRGWNTATNTPTGPTTVVREEPGNQYTEVLTMSATPAVDGGGRPTGAEAVSNVQSLSREYVNIAGQVVASRRYYSMDNAVYSTGDFGTVGTNYYLTEYAYGDGGQRVRIKDAVGTITRTVSDGMDRETETWVGTNDAGATDSDPTGGGATGNNMRRVTEYEYDGGGVGDGNVTKVTEHPTGATNSTYDRVTQVYYDWRNRVVALKTGVQTTEATTVQRQIYYYELDNLDQAVAMYRYDGDAVTVADSDGDGVPDQPDVTNLRAKSTVSYDDQGRVFRTDLFSVNQSTGDVGGSLSTNYWYDDYGNVIKIDAPNGLVYKYRYDGEDRLTRAYVTDGGKSTASPDSSWEDADDVDGDVVLEQVEKDYDAVGNVIRTVTRQRFHDALGTETGELGTPSSTTPVAKARVSYAVYYYDKDNRLTDVVDAGTNGGTNYQRPDTPDARSDTRLVTSYAYDAAGRLQDVTDARGNVTRTEYDLLGRVSRMIEAYVNGQAETSDGYSDDDRITEYTYDGNDNVLTMKAVLPSSAFQTTQYVYGVTTSGGSDVNSNDLLLEVRYPDKTSGDPGTANSDKVRYTYNALGQAKTMTDQNGTVHTYSYDVLGRPTEDAVAPVTGVDGTIRKQTISYDTGGRASQFNGYNASGTKITGVTWTYNGLGYQVTQDYQIKDFDAGTVGYTYSEDFYNNHSRLTQMTFPSGRKLRYEYNSGLDDAISRVSYLADDNAGAIGTHLEEYSYLGLGTIVERNRPEPGVKLTYVSQGTGDEPTGAGDQYTGLDRFGRVVDQRWRTTGGTPADRDRFQYGYDRGGNRLYKQNMLSSANSELYMADDVLANNAYDRLGRLKNFQRGTLSAGSPNNNNGTMPDTVATASVDKSWTLDALGNWDAVTGETQARQHNKRNQAYSVKGNTLTYDANGNMTKDERGYSFTYDAWNRLMTVKNAQNSVVANYYYDALGRRMVEVQPGGVARRFYHSLDWQVVEEQQADSCTCGVLRTRTQYVWGLGFVDDLVLRDNDADANSATGRLGNNGNQSTGTVTGLEERVYAQQDANHNVTSLANTSGQVVERYLYDPYGSVTVLNGAADKNSGVSDWSADANNTTDWEWAYLHQGGRWDADAGLYHFRHRDYSPTLGRWVQPDPAGYVDGTNLYQAYAGGPVSGFDPVGLTTIRLNRRGIMLMLAPPTTRPATRPATQASSGNDLDNRIDDLIRQMNSDDWRERERAQRELERLMRENGLDDPAGMRERVRRRRDCQNLTPEQRQRLEGALGKPVGRDEQLDAINKELDDLDDKRSQLEDLREQRNGRDFGPEANELFDKGIREQLQQIGQRRRQLQRERDALNRSRPRPSPSGAC